MDNEEALRFKRLHGKMFAALFKQAIYEHLSLPRFSSFVSRCRMDSIVWLNARFKGMILISKQRYGLYNKAADHPSSKMHKKCFPWWHA